MFLFMSHPPKHPLWLRWTHWVNFPLLALMTWSGLLIYWANAAYTEFLPEGFYAALGLDGRLAEGMYVHFALGWLFAINGLAYVAFLLAKGHWRELFPDRLALRRAWPTALHELGLRAQAPPQGKFNAVQRIAYTSALALGAIEWLSGLAIYKPVQLGWLAALFGGYEGARLVHFIGMLSLTGFFLLHVLQVARAGWRNFSAMVTGYEE